VIPAHLKFALVGASAILVAVPVGVFAQTTPGQTTPTPGPTTVVTPVAAAALTVSNQKAAPGTDLHVNGTGFQPGEKVDLSFNGTAFDPLPVADTEGKFSIDWTVPSVPAGDYGFTAKGQTSARSAVTTFTVAQGTASLTFSTGQALAGAQITATLTAGTYGATATGQTSNREANASFTVLAGPTPVTAPNAPTPTPVPGVTPPAQQPVAPAMAHDERYFSQTGYRIDNDEVWTFFNQYGNTATFGYPVSRTVTFLGCPVQFFQRQIIQVCSGQGAALMNMLDPEIFPYTRVNGSVFPAPDENLKNSTPQVSDPAYAEKMNQFIAANVPDTANGQPVNFNATFTTLGGLNIWGAPISTPQADPSNANFIYQRFQRGIMHFIAGQGTQSVLLADYLKAILMNENVPSDLLEQARESRYLAQYCPGNPQWLCRPAELGGTDLTFAFVQG
jgi:hypothetical protein